MAVTPKIRRSYKGAPVSAVLDSSGVSSATQTAITLTTSPSTWPTGKFFVVVAPGTAQEEKMCVTVSGSTMTVVDPSVTSNSASANGRGVDDTTARSTIAGGATVYPVATARDFDEANQLTATYANQGGIVYLGDPSFTQLAIGTAGQVLKVNSGATAPEWGQVAAAGIASDAVTTAKILDDAVTTAKIADNNVTFALLATVVQNALSPVGTIVAYGGSSAPTGWLLCDGSTFNATTYSSLNTVLGGNTLPDLRARVPMGKAASGTGSTLLGTGGNRKIASNHLPTHTHTIDHDHASFDTSSAGTHTHTYSGTVSSVGNHTHTYNIAGEYFFVDAGGTPAVIEGSAGTYTTNGAGGHDHTFSGTTTNTGSSHAHSIDVPSFSGNSGNGGFANDDYYQPFVAVNYIIKHDYV